MPNVNSSKKHIPAFWSSLSTDCRNSKPICFWIRIDTVQDDIAAIHIRIRADTVASWRDICLWSASFPPHKKSHLPQWWIIGNAIERATDGRWATQISFHQISKYSHQDLFRQHFDQRWSTSCGRIVVHRCWCRIARNASDIIEHSIIAVGLTGRNRGGRWQIDGRRGSGGFF